MKKSHYKNKLHEYSLLFLLLLVFFGGSVLLSQVLRQSPKTGYKGSWEPHYRTPGSQTWKYSIVVVKKECVDTLYAEPLYMITSTSCSLPTSNFERWIKQLDDIKSLCDWKIRWRKWAMRHVNTSYEEQENVYYCSKEIYDSINAGEKIEVVVTEEGSLDDYDNIRDVILEVEDSRPMIYDPDGLIYYLYHKPME